MNEHHVRSSILNYFSETYAGTVDWGDPERFDPQSEDVSSWAYCTVDNLQQGPERVERFITFRVVIQCYGRTNTDLYAASRLAANAADALRGKTFEAQDFDESAEPVVGTIRIYEPRMSDETKNLAQTGWQQVNVIFMGVAQETT